MTTDLWEQQHIKWEKYRLSMGERMRSSSYAARQTFSWPNTFSNSDVGGSYYDVLLEKCFLEWVYTSNSETYRKKVISVLLNTRWRGQTLEKSTSNIRRKMWKVSYCLKHKILDFELFKGCFGTRVSFGMPLTFIRDVAPFRERKR
jgi:hypothetical protein